MYFKSDINLKITNLNHDLQYNKKHIYNCYEKLNF